MGCLAGTTGKPKGVKVCHDSLILRMQAYQLLMPLEGSDRLLYKTPYTFGAPSTLPSPSEGSSLTSHLHTLL